MLSAQSVQQTNGLSKEVTGLIMRTLKTFKRVSSKDHFDMGRINHLVRKYAHFFTYLVLGILVMNALSRSGFIGFKILALSISICVLYAISDEVHQLFVPGRGAQVKDVLIDSAGATVGISLYSLLA